MCRTDPVTSVTAVQVVDPHLKAVEPKASHRCVRHTGLVSVNPGTEQKERVLSQVWVPTEGKPAAEGSHQG